MVAWPTVIDQVFADRRAFDGFGRVVASCTR